MIPCSLFVLAPPFTSFLFTAAVRLDSGTARSSVSDGWLSHTTASRCFFLSSFNCRTDCAILSHSSLPLIMCATYNKAYPFLQPSAPLYRYSPIVAASPLDCVPHCPLRRSCTSLSASPQSKHLPPDGLIQFFGQPTAVHTQLVGAFNRRGTSKERHGGLGEWTRG